MSPRASGLAVKQPAGERAAATGALEPIVRQPQKARTHAGSAAEAAEHNATVDSRRRRASRPAPSRSFWRPRRRSRATVTSVGAPPVLDRSDSASSERGSDFGACFASEHPRAAHSGASPTARPATAETSGRLICALACSFPLLWARNGARERSGISARPLALAPRQPVAGARRTEASARAPPAVRLAVPRVSRCRGGTVRRAHPRLEACPAARRVGHHERDRLLRGDSARGIHPHRIAVVRGGLGQSSAGHRLPGSNSWCAGFCARPICCGATSYRSSRAYAEHQLTSHSARLRHHGVAAQPTAKRPGRPDALGAHVDMRRAAVQAQSALARDELGGARQLPGRRLGRGGIGDGAVAARHGLDRDDPSSVRRGAGVPAHRTAAERQHSSLRRCRPSTRWRGAFCSSCSPASRSCSAGRCSGTIWAGESAQLFGLLSLTDQVSDFLARVAEPAKAAAQARPSERHGGGQGRSERLGERSCEVIGRMDDETCTVHATSEERRVTRARSARARCPPGRGVS